MYSERNQTTNVSICWDHLVIEDAMVLGDEMGVVIPEYSAKDVLMVLTW